MCENEQRNARDRERARSKPCALCGDAADQWLEWAFRACPRCHEELGKRIQAVIDEMRREKRG